MNQDTIIEDLAASRSLYERAVQIIAASPPDAPIAGGGLPGGTAAAVPVDALEGVSPALRATGVASGMLSTRLCVRRC